MYSHRQWSWQGGQGSTKKARGKFEKKEGKIITIKIKKNKGPSKMLDEKEVLSKC